MSDPADTGLHSLSIVLDGHPWSTATFLVDDVPILQMPGIRGTGSVPRLGPLPAFDVLPPRSAALLPSVVPTPAMVGQCFLCVPGCNSLVVRVRRVGDRVRWEPDPHSPNRTISRSWTFDLRAYLDAVDDATVAMLAGETRAHRLARELCRRRDSPAGVTVMNATTLFRFLDARARLDHRTGAAHLSVEVAGPLGEHWYRIPTPADRSDDEILHQLSAFVPEELVREGGGAWSTVLDEGEPPMNAGT